MAGQDGVDLGLGVFLSGGHFPIDAAQLALPGGRVPPDNIRNIFAHRPAFTGAQLLDPVLQLGYAHVRKVAQPRSEIKPATNTR
jgi:hypothetical protein